MAAMIEYVCTAPHDRREEPSVTLEPGSWAYCSWGAATGHEWTHIEPTAIEALRSPAGNGRARLVPDEERSRMAPAAHKRAQRKLRAV